jgi:hypothetical protein
MKTTTTSACATVQAFHARVAAADKKWHEQQEVQKEQEFKDKYSPCNISSTYHDLQCGHRVQTEYTLSCGVLCVRSVRGQPFLCPTCLIDVVRAEVALDGLTLKPSDDTATAGTDPTQDDKVHYFADKYVATMLMKGYRSCKAVPKLEEPLDQFFDQFMRAEGLGGLQDERVKEEVVHPRKRRGTTAGRKPARQSTPYQRPGKWDYREPSTQAVASDKLDRVLPGADAEDKDKKSRCLEDATNGVLGPSTGSYVTLPSEDDATEAVQKAMEAFALL